MTEAVRIPDLFVIGAAKSGTTSLHRYLDQHPDVFMSSKKEPNFFCFEGGVPEFRMPDVGSLDRALVERIRHARYLDSITRFEEYAELFRQARARVVGESSCAYLYFPETAGAIRARAPSARIVAILRHPVDRAYSKFLEFRTRGCEPLDDFAAALRAEDDRAHANWSPTWLYKRRGLYAAQLAPYFACFPRERIHVILFDELCTDPLGTLRTLFAFLDVDPGFIPDVRVHHNSLAEARRLSRSGALVSLRRAAARRLLPERVRGRARERWDRLRGPAPPAAAPELPPELRRKLLAEFRVDIVQLQDLIGRDLSPWLR